MAATWSAAEGAVACHAPNNSVVNETVALRLSLNGQQTDGALDYLYANPRISSFVPNAGPAAGGTVLAIAGTELETRRVAQHGV